MIASFFTLHSYAQQEFSAQLEMLDNIKSSDNKRFNKLLAELESEYEHFSDKQAQYFKYLKAYSAVFSGKLEEAIHLSKELAKEQLEPNIKFKTNLLLLNTLAISKNWLEGLSYLSSTIDTLSEITDRELREKGIGVVLQTYNLYGQYQENIDFAYPPLTEESTIRNQCLIKWLNLDAKFQSKILETYSTEIDSVLSLCREANEPMVASLLRIRHAQLYLSKNNADQALSILLMHFDEISKVNYRRITTEAQATIAKAYYAKGLPSKAKFHAQEALNNISGLENTEPAAQAYSVLFNIAEKDNKHKDALFYHKKFVATDRAFLDEIEAKALAFQKAKQNSIQQQSQIELLNNQNELLNSRNELLKAEQSLAQSEAENTRLVAALLMAIVTLLTFFGYRSWRTQRRLKTLAEYDYLTKVYNRGHFMTIAEDTLALAQKAKQNVTCIIFDLDKFKSVNDTYGHSAGDWALKATVAAVKDCIRENDIFARLGGEEFIILLPSCDIQAATYVAEKCIHKLQKIDTTESGHDFTITASFGITTSKTSGYDISALSMDADAALYKSKDNGRNQLTIFEK